MTATNATAWTEDPGRGLLIEIVLRDGTPALIWPLLPTDRGVVREAFAALSDESRYHRFLSSVSELSEPTLRRLVDEVDGVDHVALVVVVAPLNGPDQVVGFGRIVRDANDTAAADIAVVVADEWQGRGVGSALLEALLARRPTGVTQLQTVVAADNVASRALLARLGTVHAAVSAPGVLEVRVDLPPMRGQHRGSTSAARRPRRPGPEQHLHPGGSRSCGTRRTAWTSCSAPTLPSRLPSTDPTTPNARDGSPK